jgi:general secretion pathway protein H
MAKTRMLPTGSRTGATAGFTLLDLIVVLTIVALALALVAPNMLTVTDAQALKADTRLTVGGLNYARARSISLNTPVVLVIDPLSHRVTTDDGGRLGTLSEATNVGYLVDQQVSQQGGQVTIGFFPDGSSSGGDIVLYRGGTQYRVNVNWLTGAVTTSEGR